MYSKNGKSSRNDFWDPTHDEFYSITVVNLHDMSKGGQLVVLLDHYSVWVVSHE